MGNCAGIVSTVCRGTGRPSLPNTSPSPSPFPSAQPPARQVLKGPMKDIRATYTFGRELGRGEFGVTHICIDMVTKKRYACKSIAKRKLVTNEYIQDVRREVEILHHVWGYRNIVQFEGVYEDKLAVHLVLELCTGGELFDRITTQGRYTEQAAAALCRTIVEVIQTCHSLFVMHRDIKPENFLFASPNKDAPLKVTDFGLAVIFKPGQKFTDVVGSAYYIAPEVLRKDYGPEADVWSAGVILYILLSGSPPFSPDSDKEEDILAAIRQGNLDLTSEIWQSISDGAKDLVRKMLTQDPKARLKPHEILNHPWIRVDGEAPDKPLDDAVLTRLRKFRAMNNLKKVALKVIAKSLSEEEIQGLKQIFANMDEDKSGTITFEELKQGLGKQGSNLAESEIRQILESADVDRTGTLNYEDFLAATIHMNKLDKEEHLFSAFQYFDKDNSGYITKDELELALALHNMMDEAAIKNILAEADTNQDGKIDYEEFAVMMRKGMAPPPPPPLGWR